MFVLTLVRLGIPVDSITELIQEKLLKDGNVILPITVSIDEDVMRLQDYDIITIVTNINNNNA